MADPVNPSVNLIETAILDILNEVGDFNDVHPGENIEPTAYPAASATISFVVKGDEQTGGLVEYGWRWVVRLYWDLTDPDYYELYKAVLLNVIRKFQSNPSLNDTCYRHDLKDSGPAVPIPARGVLIKTFEVVAEVEEDDEF